MTQPKLPLKRVDTHSNGAQDLCRYCGKPYVPIRNWHRFCSSACRTAHRDETNPRINALKGQLGKERGMALAAANAAEHLQKLRDIARDWALTHGTCDADIVQWQVDRLELDIPKGPFWGSIFRGGEWEFTGQRRVSAQSSNHGRELKVWRLRR